jgi:hypothetical protein
MPGAITRLCTQLNYRGNCREAFRFYGAHLGGKIVMMMIVMMKIAMIMTNGRGPNANRLHPAGCPAPSEPELSGYVAVLPRSESSNCGLGAFRDIVPAYRSPVCGSEGNGFTNAGAFQ